MSEREPGLSPFQFSLTELIRASKFYVDYPEEVLAEAARIPAKLTPEEKAEGGRKDLRALPFITIDGTDAKDFDDAVYIERRKEGFHLWVAISDVAHYVQEGSALDAYALERATSVYLADRVLPMLPERLSNEMCSLLPGEERLCLVADMVLDAQGRFLETEIYPAIIRSAARLTYGAVQTLFDGAPSAELKPFVGMLEAARALATRLHALRIARGALEFQSTERRVEFEAGEPAAVRLCRQTESHRLIEAFMLRANEAVARYAERRGLPVLFRCHGPPDEKKLQIFSKAVKALGLSLDKPNPRGFTRLLKQVRGGARERLLEHLLLRSMSSAEYTGRNEGHYGLGSSAYLHFTSPIRRYPDLWTHRVLKAYWAQRLLPVEAAQLLYLGKHCSEQEYSAMKFERDIVAFSSACLAEKYLGKTFQGTIVAFAKMGCFVELEGLWIEGLIWTKGLGKAAVFDEKSYCIRLPNGHKLELGMRCTVRISSVQPEQGFVRLKCLSLPKGVGRGLEGRKRKGRRRE